MKTGSNFGLFWSIGGALLLGVGVLTLVSPTPLESLFHFFIGPLRSPLAWGQILNQGSLLTLTGLGVALAFSSGSFNLGGEGQVYGGALVALIVGLGLPNLPFWVVLPLALSLGALGGGVLAGASGFLKVKTGADELITSFLLSAAVIPLIDGAIASAFLRDNSSFLMTTRTLPLDQWIPTLFSPSRIHWGTLVVFPLALLVQMVLYSTPWGYELRMTGRSRTFANYAGFSVNHYHIWPMALSGMLHGLAGSLAVFGVHHAVIHSFSEGLGWNGIAVALIARNRPLAVIPAALFLAYLTQASRTAQIFSNFPFELSWLIQGLILLTITSQLRGSHR